MFNKYNLIAKAVMALSCLSSVSQAEKVIENNIGVRPSHVIPNITVQEVCRASDLADVARNEVIEKANDLWQWEVKNNSGYHRETCFVEDMGDLVQVEYAYDKAPISYLQQEKPIITGEKPFSLIEIEADGFTIIEAEQLSKSDGYPTTVRQEQITGDELNYQKVNFEEEDGWVKLDYHYDRKEYLNEKAKEHKNRVALHNDLAFYPEDLRLGSID